MSSNIRIVTSILFTKFAVRDNHFPDIILFLMTEFIKSLRVLAFFALMLLPAVSFAVTDKEMEQARTIAAKWYIRYVNDGSGYLDEINPTTIADLEKNLKPKEQENIKAFLAIQVPPSSEYSSWDKDKLVEFWVGAFQDKGLQEKGRGGRIRTRSQINKMTIAAPKAESAVAHDNVPVASEPSQPSEQNMSVSPVDSITGTLSPEEQEILSDMDNVADVSVERANNYTWVYIVALAILVGLVIALIVYATNVLKKNAAFKPESREDNSRVENNDELKEKFEAIVADKEVEIAMLTKKLESANRRNQELTQKLESLSAEIETLRNRTETGARPAGSKQESVITDYYNETEPPVKRTPLHTIYLGRANTRGIFVRADRNLNVGHSVFILDTTDGFTGTFKVADSPASWSLALSNPPEYLYSACIVTNSESAPEAERIVTESSGTAIFEGGCWRVIRKAKIRFE